MKQTWNQKKTRQTHTTHTGTHPVLTTQQYNELPDEKGRVLVYEVFVAHALLSFVLGKLYNIHLMGVLSDIHKYTQR